MNKSEGVSWLEAANLKALRNEADNASAWRGLRRQANWRQGKGIWWSCSCSARMQPRDCQVFWCFRKSHKLRTSCEIHIFSVFTTKLLKTTTIMSVWTGFRWEPPVCKVRTRWWYNQVVCVFCVLCTMIANWKSHGQNHFENNHTTVTCPTRLPWAWGK